VKLPFQKNKAEEQLPSEVQDYYQAEKREKQSLAWLLALGTLVVTVALALGVFFGGRWVYRKIANKPSTPATTTPGPSQTVQTPQPKDTQTEDSDGSNQPTPQADEDNDQTPAASTPATGPIPRTGPDGEE
jgi:cytoskeletal protein RodZ